MLHPLKKNLSLVQLNCVSSKLHFFAMFPVKSVQFFSGKVKVTFFFFLAPNFESSFIKKEVHSLKVHFILFAGLGFLVLIFLKKGLERHSKKL